MPCFWGAGGGTVCFKTTRKLQAQNCIKTLLKEPVNIAKSSTQKLGDARIQVGYAALIYIHALTPTVI